LQASHRRPYGGDAGCDRGPLMRFALLINERLADILGHIAGLLVLIIFVLIVGEVFSRKFFNVSSRFTWEYIGYMTGAVIFLGLAYTQKSGGHIRLKILNDSIGTRACRYLDFLGTAFAVGIVGYLTWALGHHAYLSWLRGSLAPTAMRTPLFIPQGILALGAFLYLLQLCARLVRIVFNEAVDPKVGETSFDGE
jgi:C4-dicarboxylate transporter, DctQ subunit